mgnify:CR=1 FL=1
MNEKRARYILVGTTVLESLLACGFAWDAAGKIVDGRYKEAGLEVGLSLYFSAMSYLGGKRIEWVYKTSPEFMAQLRKAKEDMVGAASDLRDYFIAEKKRREKQDQNFN